MDLRTREGIEQQIIDQVRESGGFSIFWITDNQKRDCAAMRLEERGDITGTGGGMPWCGYKLKGDTDGVV